MIIEHLSLTNFRNYARLECLFDPGKPVILHGENAQGKTSLLEAIYYLATARSPYTTSDRQLLNWATLETDLPFARIAADIASKRHGNSRLEVTLMLETAADGARRFRKVVRLNGVNKRVMDVIGVLTVVLFLPRDLTLVEGSPADRRRFMDATLSQIDAGYAAALDQYEKTLPQRNALLRRIADRLASPAELDYWDAQLVSAGSKIIAERQRFLRDLELIAQRNHFDLTGRRETLTLSYQPSFAPTADDSGQMAFDVRGLDLHRDLPPEQIAPQFADRLRAEQAESIRRGMTLSGPHRDELRLMINARDAGLYGSRGQARTAVMALKFAELTCLRDRTGDYPLLLLDEVAAELDSQRRAYLLERIDGKAQTLVTTTELDIFAPAFLARSLLWRVENGQISEGQG